MAADVLAKKGAMTSAAMASAKFNRNIPESAREGSIS